MDHSLDKHPYTYLHQIQVCLRHMILQPYQEYGTIVLVLLEAQTHQLSLNVAWDDCMLVFLPSLGFGLGGRSCSNFLASTVLRATYQQYRG